MNTKFHPDLQAIFDYLLSESLHIEYTSTTREIHDHIRIYRELAESRGEKLDWDSIPWKSRHLPTHKTPFCRAADIRVFDGQRKLTGQEIAETIVRRFDVTQFPIGLGIASTWCHVDVDRRRYTQWTYG